MCPAGDSLFGWEVGLKADLQYKACIHLADTLSAQIFSCSGYGFRLKNAEMT